VKRANSPQLEKVTLWSLWCMLVGSVAFGMIVWSGCKESQSKNDPRVASVFATNSIGIAALSTGNYVLDLLKDGRLPGLSKDDHGLLESDTLPLSKGATYPVSRTFRVTKSNDPGIYLYKVVRKTENDEWQLQRAWKTDSKGSIIAEWLVK
jgi:hypothetical protein